MVISREIAASRLRRLEQSVKRLTALADMPLDEYLADADAHAIAERHFQIAVQCLLDIGNHIVAEQGLGTPDAASGILVLVHDYLEIDHRTVHGLLQRVGDLVELGRVVGDYIDRQSGDEPRQAP